MTVWHVSVLAFMNKMCDTVHSHVVVQVDKMICTKLDQRAYILPVVASYHPTVTLKRSNEKKNRFISQDLRAKQ